jgi:hypothetical protein
MKGAKMFGLDNKNADLSFEIEKELKGPNHVEKRMELKQLLNKRVEELKSLLREGEDKEEFEKTEILLHGYMSLLKVIEKIVKK